MPDAVTLLVNGQRFDGWTTVVIERGLEELAGAFTLTLSERWPGRPDQWRIEAGDACELSIGGELISTGWIDFAAYRLGAVDHPVEMSGREKTGDLVDCSSLHRPGSWRGRTLDQIAAELTAPFGVAVSAETDVGAPFDGFALEPGETVFDALDRMARQRGVLLTTSASGDLVLTRPAASAAAYRLEEGVNLEAVAFENDVSQRFSAYRLLGHDPSDESAGSPAARPEAEAGDAGVRRHRPLVIVNDEGSTAAGLADRARWEASVRAAQGQVVTATVSGWRTADGDLYRPNQRVTVEAPTVGVRGELLVSGVRFSRAANEGSRTELRLVRPEAFSLAPVEAGAARRTAATPPGSGG